MTMANHTATRSRVSGHALMHDHAEPVGHGNSPAAWTAVFIMLAGTIVGCIGFMMASWPVFIAGWIVIALGLIIGGIMRALGFGVGGSRLKNPVH